MALDARMFSFIATGLFALTLILTIVINILPSWATNEALGIKATVGLWRGCVEYAGQSACTSLSCSSVSTANCALLNVARAFLILACIEIVLSLVSLGMILRGIDYGNGKLVKNVKLCGIICFFILIIGVSCGIHVTTNGASWGPGSILALITLFIALGAAVTSALIK